ncbi:MAG TPA: four helix bundle protein [Candidatus Cloacimonas sp.]|nr:four helix bundle protein [Candidatus Cloacimonas sp.]HPS60200.1 four helix bundle protein [Candidatus Cloacimonas sp.]
MQVWKVRMLLCADIHQRTQEFSGLGQYELTAHLRRTALSIHCPLVRR